MLTNLIDSLKNDFRLTDEGHLKIFLRVNFIYNNNNILEINQLHLIRRILKALSLNDNTKMHNTLANYILYRDKDSKKRIQQ